jgi:hypothetical protein
MRPLAEILEIKDTLAGAQQTFRCHAVARRNGEMVLLYILPSARTVGGLALPAGTVTFGYFWEDRPYNVYHWMTPQGATIAFYANLADETQIGPDTLRFRDLTVDVLIPPQGAPLVLDEDELPPALDAPTRQSITRARALVLAAADDLRAELGARSAALWPGVFAEGPL